MSMTRDEFLSAIVADISSYPTAAQYYQAGDPRLLAQLGAMATMLSMLSQQIDAQSMEPFIKARDTTVLADASVKGILPFSRPARVNLSVQNTHASASLVISVGRRFIDQQGHTYIAEQGVTIVAGATGTVPVKQLTTRTFNHTVSGSVPFYAVQIPASTDDDLSISGVFVSIAGVNYPYTVEFANVAADQPGFTLETDEYRKLYAKFGWANTFGVQPANGAVINFTIEETAGLIALPIDAPFTFETSTGIGDDLAKITLSAVTFPGSNPVDIQTLREWAQYPSTYDASAVYLGNFDFLIRRNIAALGFLSVWNEKIEEAARGASVNNINRLFIAALMDGATQSWLESEIAKVVNAADDSYYLQFVPAVSVAVPVTINAKVSVVHDPAAVVSKVKSVLLGLYGPDAPATKHGMLALSHKRIYDEIRAKVPELQDSASDFQIVLPDGATPVKPEDFRYVTGDSITVNVSQSTYNDGLWSH